MSHEMSGIGRTSLFLQQINRLNEFSYEPWTKKKKKLFYGNGPITNFNRLTRDFLTFVMKSRASTDRLSGPVIERICDKFLRHFNYGPIKNPKRISSPMSLQNFYTKSKTSTDRPVRPTYPWEFETTTKRTNKNEKKKQMFHEILSTDRSYLCRLRRGY